MELATVIHASKDRSLCLVLITTTTLTSIVRACLFINGPKVMSKDKLRHRHDASHADNTVCVMHYKQTTICNFLEVPTNSFDFVEQHDPNIWLKI